MTISKGDLVLVSNGEVTSTCIILTEEHHSMGQLDFFYTYCLETGMYGIIYKNEILSVVSEGFAPEFETNSTLFDENYKYYSGLYEQFSYFPDFYLYDFNSLFEETEEPSVPSGSNDSQHKT